ncbi:hypothetical protein H6P81_004569 [Aristolochia fimbriata]|uniref:MINDY deubiquitinase domain-containing protein n=1 Tax=Aristolochia fimbriata TaxID=158543 RepID=A0AAV7ES23_ARIFI|nr:hypothetical protein H6P81_004569 [Aristolochia fimbriata]
MAAEDRKDDAELEGLYKTKTVHFFGRSVPIILQNANGPCPLIAICNVLLLRNNITISSEASEISLKKLLSLVAERLLDSNSNIQDKDAGYLENQQQNIHDAIEMLPRLATGIDVNLHFSRIDDFEFTPERSIFDLLGIELYHGWIVDPQDVETLEAIGTKSYNSLMAEIVALEDTNNREREDNDMPVEDCIDFAAATTATLGVPSPCLSRARSFEDSVVAGEDQKTRKGDREEEEELLRVLQLSKADASSSLNESSESIILSAPSVGTLDTLEASVSGESERPLNLDAGKSTVQLSSEIGTETGDRIIEEECCLSNCDKSDDCPISSGLAKNINADLGIQAAGVPSSDGDVSSVADISGAYMNDLVAGHSVRQVMLDVNRNARPKVHLTTTEDTGETDNNQAGSMPLDEKSIHVDVPKACISANLENSEPIYEGEECILDPAHPVYEHREPLYEGEMVLAERADGVSGEVSSIYKNDEVSQKKHNGKHGISAREGELIQNFLKNNASQLTIYGLFCLQEGLKEHELCVFFRNNHFNTMFKFNGELYLLATDQGYLNQPDLVWEKLNEVNGDTMFMTGNFTEFSAENQASATWDEQNAVASTADYLATIDKTSVDSSDISSDLQLAIALQQQEFEQQQQHSQRQNGGSQQQSSVSGASRLITGPQVPRSTGTSVKPEGKSKDKEKCAVM